MQSLPLVDFGVKWFTDIVGTIIGWFASELADGLNSIASDFFRTPLPSGSGSNVVFGTPSSSDQPWQSIYQSVVAGETMLIALLILALFVQGRHAIRIFNVGGAYEAQQSRRSAWTGAFLIVAWYWIAVLGLYVVDGLTVALLPELGVVTDAVLGILPTAAGNPAITLVMAMLGGLSMVALEAIFFLRELLLYIYLYGMPIGLAIAFGNVPVISQIASRLCKQMIPLAALPLPAAILFRGYELLFVGDAVVVPESDFLQYLVVVSLPMLALLVTWKTFRYASPLTTRVIGTASVAAVTVGGVVGAGYAAGPYAATTAARWGPKAAAGQVLSEHAFSNSDEQDQSGQHLSTDNLAPRTANGGAPAYRRAEDDPSYY
ncbi:hypothetical protein [Halomarina rubra]|uniref:Type IV secretion system protein TrbL n=1 Tax=Halomarina rubra TaxID=2071873 RepID=A0ABD6AWH6_9EURY|nr:hypothetical protein [Halomarina rubra]